MLYYLKASAPFVYLHGTESVHKSNERSAYERKFSAHGVGLQILFSVGTEEKGKVIYGHLKVEIGQILRKLCEYKGIKIIVGKACVDHIHSECVCPFLPNTH